MKTFLSVIVFFSFSICSLYGKQLPSYVKKCKRDDPGLDDCVKNAFIDFKKYLPDGIKEMRIPPMNPLVLEKATLGAAGASAVLTNVKIYHVPEFDLTYFKIDLNNNKMWVNLTFNYLELDSDYDLTGKVGGFTLHGDGKFIANFSDTQITIEITGKTVEKKGEDYIQWNDVNLKILADSLKYFDLTNLFQNNPSLTESFLQFARENQSELTPEAIPLVEKILVTIVSSIVNGVFGSYSINELFD